MLKAALCNEKERQSLGATGKAPCSDACNPVKKDVSVSCHTNTYMFQVAQSPSP